MEPDRWSRIKAIFQTALELQADERESWVESVCGADAELRSEVLALLAAHQPDDAFLARPPAGIAAEVLAGDAATADAGRAGAADSASRSGLEGQRLGPYRILRRVGRGGIGAVYLAVRDDAFRKRVAVKVIRGGMATRDVLARFRSERQILASIEHPGIARLMDGGTTPQGLPYLVMEYIEGVPIDAYCDSRRLTLRERLGLFLTVCEAVQVAHQSLVIHRDIKPGNILVTADGRAKLLDFGIAKILDPGHPGALAEATRPGMRVFTPEYASPEQLRGGPVTTASDVYSLGVLLYLLLCGRLPHEVGGRSIVEAERLVGARQPDRPSEAAAKPSDVAERRSATPAQLVRDLRGDLDNIALRALRKEAERRYSSPERLAADVRRHLEDRPVEARPDTVGYRAAKFVRRNRAAVAAAAAAAALALAFVVSLWLQSQRLERARALAERQATRATAVSEFLQGVLSMADPLRGLAHDATVLDALERAEARIEGAFTGAPDLEAAVRHSIGMTYLRLGRYDDAGPQLGRAWDLRREHSPEETEAVVESLAALGLLRQARGEYAAADELLSEALGTARSRLGPSHRRVATVLGHLATVRHDRGLEQQAEALYRESLELRRQVFGREHAEYATALDDLANLVHDRGDLETAEKMYREALEIRRRVLDPRHPDLSTSLNNLGAVLNDRGLLDEAEALYRQSLEMARESFGEKHPDVASSLNNLASLLHDRERLAEAEALYRQSLEMSRDLLGADHPQTADALQNLAALLHDRGDLATAETLYREAIAVSRRGLGEGHPSVALAVENLAELLTERGEQRQAEALLRQSLAAGRSAAAGDRDLAIRLGALATLLMNQGREREAAELLEEALERAERAAAEASLMGGLRLDLADCLIELARFEEARSQLLAAQSVLSEQQGGEEEQELRRGIVERLAALPD